MNDTVFLTLMLAPAGLLTLSAIYMGVRIGGLGAWLVAIGSAFAFALGSGQVITQRPAVAVFDDAGNQAGAMIDSGLPASLVVYGGPFSVFLMALGLALLTHKLTRRKI
jgi:hypothetical protein